MPGGPDPLYVAARGALLDALEAVDAHLDAIVIVGAQAIYLNTPDTELPVAPYTTDADLGLDPSRLADEPLLERLLRDAGFEQDPRHVGIWTKEMPVEGIRRSVDVDLLVPASLGGPGRRGARIPPHDKRAARKVNGLEGALVDREVLLVGALDEQDPRSFPVAVAGPAALIVAKIHKMRDRAGTEGRESDKDALDVFRLLRAVRTDDLARRLEALKRDDRSRNVASQAIHSFSELFGTARSPGCRMAARALTPMEPEATTAASAAALAQDLIRLVGLS